MLQKHQFVRTNQAFIAKTMFFLIILSFFCLGAAHTWAEPEAPWVHERFSADTARYFQVAALSSPPPEAEVRVLYQEEQVVYDDQKRATTTSYMVYQVLGTSGVNGWDSISWFWSPWYQNRPNIEARVLTTDGKIHALSEADIIEQAPTNDDGKVYSDRRVLKAPLPGVSVGVIVEQRVVVQDTRPLFEAGSVERFFFGHWSPTLSTRLILDFPTSLTLRYGTFLLPDVKPEKSENAGRTHLVFDQGPQAAWESVDSYQPSELARRPSVIWSTASSWHDVASYYSDQVDAKISQGNLKELVTNLVAKASDRDAKISAFISWLAKEIRYTGIEFGDAAIIPHTPDETLNWKYGDCKDKASLLVSLLRQAGIAAEVALLKTGPGEDAHAEYPGMGNFDHAIVHVSQSPELWIDPTDEYSRFGQLPISDQGRLALLASRQTQGLVTIPKAPAATNLLLEERTVTMADYGNGRIKEVAHFSGYLESWYRSYYAYRKEDKRLELTSDHADDEYRTRKIEKLTVTDPADLQTPFVRSFEAPDAPRSWTDLNQASLWIRYEHVFDRLPEFLRTEPEKPKDKKPIKKRQTPVLLPQPFATELRYKITPPEGFTNTVLPKNRSENFGPGLLSETYNLEKDGSVSAIVRFETVKEQYSPAEVDELRNKILDIENKTPIQICFEPSTKVLFDQGQAAESFKLHRQMVNAHPDRPHHHLRYAMALLNMGLGEAARAEARKAVEVAPANPLAWQTLGYILRCDLVGRENRVGSDLPGARAAYEKAYSLDKEDNDAQGNLAILYEYNDEGVRYGYGAPLDKAIATYKAMGKEGLKKADLTYNLSYALLYHGDYQAAFDEAKSLDNPPLVILTASEAMLHSPASAFDLVVQKKLDNNQRAETFRTAGSILLNLRQYPQSAALIKAGAIGDTAAQNNALAATLEKTQDSTIVLQTGTDAEKLARSFFVEIIKNQKTIEPITQNFTQTSRQILEDPKHKTQQVQSLNTLAGNLRQWGFSREVMSDLILQLIQVKTDSNNGAYRLRTGVQGSFALALLVVKEGDTLKIVDLATTPSLIGVEILNEVKAGNLAQAKQFLDYIREDSWAGNVDDPVSGAPFARFWKKGQNANAETIRTAAAIILTNAPETANLGVPILLENYPNLQDGPEKDIIACALTQGLFVQSKFSDAVEYVNYVNRRFPDSPTALDLQSEVLIGAYKTETAIALSKARIQKEPQDKKAYRNLARAYTRAGQYNEAIKVLSTMIDNGLSDGLDYNEMAWDYLFVEKTGTKGLEIGLKASQARQNDTSILHTIACLFVENNQLKEAKDTLVKSMDLLGQDAPDDNYRYLQGVIAEKCGLTDLAVALYQSLPKPEQTYLLESSTYTLAQKKLKDLQQGIK